jgi:hypothetical protein
MNFFGKKETCDVILKALFFSTFYFRAAYDIGVDGNMAC